MDKLKPCPNCANLKHPDFPCIRCYPLNPVFVRRPASNTNTDTALAAAEARIAELEERVESCSSRNETDCDRIAALEKALEPFAREEVSGMYKDAWHLHFSDPEGFVDFTDFTIGDLRRAAALLKEKE